MTDKRITDLDELIAPDAQDFLVAVDVSDLTTPGGTTKKVKVKELLSKTQFFGWASYADGQYDSVTPQAISSGVRTLMQNNAAGAATNQTYLNESSPLWVNDAIIPTAVGDAYDVRVTFKAKAVSIDTDITLDLDIGTGGAPVKIAEETRRMLKGAGIENSFIFSFPIFCLETFFANGGRFYLTPTGNITIYNFNITLIKTFRNV